MYRLRLRGTAALLLVAAAVALAVAPTASHAARVGVLSNQWSSETAADFGTKVAGHTFGAIDVGTSVPTLGTLTSRFDVLLLFEDTTFAPSTAVGNLVAAFANTGRPVVLGTFYEQDRTDAPSSLTPHGWGALETLDPNTTDGTGTPYAPRSLDSPRIVSHPLTAGISTLTSAKFAGGNQAKAGTTVVAKWAQQNARGQDDPAIAYRVTGPACVIHVAIAPSYPMLGGAGTDFGGDFYRVWKNAFDFAAGGCVTAVTGGPFAIPAISGVTLGLTVLLLAALGMAARRRPTRR
jgi:hypothetical protein